MLTRFNDCKKQVIDVDSIETIDFDPTVIRFEDDLEYFMRLNLKSGNYCILSYYDSKIFEKDKNYLENNLIFNIR